MENQIQIFSNQQFGEIRAVNFEGETWFVAADVCKALDLKDTSKTTERLDEDELIRIKIGSGGQLREMIAVNEAGLYSLILSSHKVEAKLFKRWITHEVLPTIRQTGNYSSNKKPKTPAELFLESAKILAEHEKQLLTIQKNQTQQKEQLKEIEEKTDKLQKMVAPSNFLRPVEKRFMRTRSEVFSLRKILNLNYADIWNGIEKHLNSKFKIDLQQELAKVKESYRQYYYNQCRERGGQDIFRKMLSVLLKLKKFL